MLAYEPYHYITKNEWKALSIQWLGKGMGLEVGLAEDVARNFLPPHPITQCGSDNVNSIYFNDVIQKEVLSEIGYLAIIQL